MPKTGENIYKRKDGRWEGRFISGRRQDGRAKYTSVYARTYATAKAKLEERKRMVVSPPVVNCRLTVAELFAWYLAQAEIKPSTRARYVFLIDHHILPYLGSVFVPALTAAQLTDFLNQKKQNGRLRGGGLSAKSVRDIGVLIKAALRLASAEYHFYCDALNTKLPTAKQRKIEPFSSGELAQLGKALLPSGNHSLAEATPFTAEEVPVSGEGKLRSGFQHFVRPAVQVVFTDLVGADVLASRLVDGHGNLVDVVDIIEKLQAAQRVAFVFTSLSEGLFSLAFTFHWR